MKVALDLTPEDLCASLVTEGWEGFSLLRRYLAAHPGPSRSLARRIESIPWAQRGDLASRAVRFAFLGDLSTANLRDPLLLESLARGIVPFQYHAPPGQVAREVRDPTGGLWSHGADVVVLAVSGGRGHAAFRPDARGSEPWEPLLDTLVDTLRAVRERSDAAVLVHSFLAPEFRPLGLNDWREPGGLGERYSRLNLSLAERCREVPGVHLVDLGRLAALSGSTWWSLHRSRFLGNLDVPEQLAPWLSREYAAAGAALRGLVRKCLVVDLDDTLWGGVVGELGAGGVELGEGHPGSIYLETQRLVLQLHERGVILAINSHNDEEDAWGPFEQRREMVLRRHHFAAWRINWRDKAANLRELSAELGIGLDSMVVLDDDPVARSWIEEQLPEVHVLPWQDPLDMLHALATTRLFDGLELTAEDQLRGGSYAAASLRRTDEDAAADREAFLAELNLVVEVGRASAPRLPRLAQLAQRTNQFNLTTRRHTHAQLAELLDRGDAEIFYCSCRDRFADEGVTGLVILLRRERAWVIDTFLLSCRVLGWGVELALLAAACRVAERGGAAALEGVYVPTPKNGQCQWFFRDAGFSAAGSGETGPSSWRLALPRPQCLPPPWIRLRLMDGEK